MSAATLRARATVRLAHELCALYTQAAKEASLIPAGMRLLSDQERMETLEILASNRNDVESDLQRLPVVVETLSQVKHKTALERKLQELEDAIKVFSRPKVLVRSDA